MKPVSGKRMCQILGSRGWRLARISVENANDAADVACDKPEAPAKGIE